VLIRRNLGGKWGRIRGTEIWHCWSTHVLVGNTSNDQWTADY
jgi:hypothetical protein